MNFLHHLLIPHSKNNYRSKILHEFSLVILIVLLTILSTTFIFIHKVNPQVLGISYQISDQELLNLTNQQRQKNGLAPLTLDKDLTIASQNKANYMFKYNYWAHFAPDGTSPWKFIKDSGYDYVYAGENLAKGFTTADDAVTAWMNSPSHRENMLSPHYKDVGFAVEEGNLQGEDTVLIVQMFGSRDESYNAKSITLSGITSSGSAGSLQKIAGSSAEPNTLGTFSMQKTFSKNPMFNLMFGTKAISFIVLSLLLIALILDFAIVGRKRIPRVVGNNLDHIMLLTLFIVFIFIVKLGNVM